VENDQSEPDYFWSEPAAGGWFYTKAGVQSGPVDTFTDALASYYELPPADLEQRPSRRPWPFRQRH
jgi:hypothetical protein